MVRVFTNGPTTVDLFTYNIYVQIQFDNFGKSPVDLFFFLPFFLKSSKNFLHSFFDLISKVFQKYITLFQMVNKLTFPPKKNLPLQ